MSGLVRTTSAMVARPISAEARPAQKQQVWRLIPVACLGLVAASCMWLACWLKPGEAAQSSWLQGECEVHSGTVRRTPNDPQYYSVRLEAQFYHQHQGLGLSSPADVWANEFGSELPDDSYGGDSKPAARAEADAETYRRSYIDCCGSAGTAQLCMHSGLPCMYPYQPPAECRAVGLAQCQSSELPVQRLFGALPRTFGCEDCPGCCSAKEYATPGDTWAPGSRYRRHPCWIRSTTTWSSSAIRPWVRLSNPQIIQGSDSPSMRSVVWSVLVAIAGFCFCGCGFGVLVISYEHSPKSRMIHGALMVLVLVWTIALMSADKNGTTENVLYWIEPVARPAAAGGQIVLPFVYSCVVLTLCACATMAMASGIATFFIAGASEPLAFLLCPPTLTAEDSDEHAAAANDGGGKSGVLPVGNPLRTVAAAGANQNQQQLRPTVAPRPTEPQFPQQPPLPSNLPFARRVDHTEAMQEVRSPSEHWQQVHDSLALDRRRQELVELARQARRVSAGVETGSASLGRAELLQSDHARSTSVSPFQSVETEVRAAELQSRSTIGTTPSSRLSFVSTSHPDSSGGVQPRAYAPFTATTPSSQVAVARKPALGGASPTSSHSSDWSFQSDEERI